MAWVSTIDLRLDGCCLAARLGGAPLEAMSKEIKAVTYHNLRVQVGAEECERGSYLTFDDAVALEEGWTS